MSLSSKRTETGTDLRKQTDTELEGLAALPYRERLAEFVRGSTRHWVDDSITVVDFRPLYAIAIHNLQHQLAQQIQVIQKHEEIGDKLTDEQLETIQKLVKEYTNSLRDFEFIHSNRFDTVFVKDIAASRLDNGPGSKLAAALISELGLDLPKPQQTIYSDSDLLGAFDHNLLQHSAKVGKSRGSERHVREERDKQIKRLKATSHRFVFALVGALAIVVPILIIAVEFAALKTLIVVSVSIFLFALGVALFSSAAPESLLGATATYAAVLMVFMNSNTSNVTATSGVV
ncbi:hypothetical protein B0J14DRAFT_203391 [Halenospora varia]|nr:hypothetical protein B0J14DRAFT_203391 [Halenospora varia]